MYKKWALDNRTEMFWREDMERKNEKIENFTAFMEETAMSENTIASYLGRLDIFWRWCETSFGSAPDTLYRMNMLDFRNYLQNVRKLSPVTINTYLSALRMYNDFLIASGVQETSIFRKRDYLRVDAPGTNPWEGEEKDVHAMRQRVLTDDKRHGKRNYALLTLMSYGGLRVSEAACLRCSDIHLASREISVQGKGNAFRTVMMNEKIAQALQEYLAERGEDTADTPYLFTSQKGGHLSRTQIYTIVKKYSNGQLHPHMLRHFFCTKSQEVGYQIHQTAQQAGHKDPRTTLRYTHPSKKEMLEKANLM